MDKNKVQQEMIDHSSIKEITKKSSYQTQKQPPHYFDLYVYTIQFSDGRNLIEFQIYEEKQLAVVPELDHFLERNYDSNIIVKKEYF